ncbi:tyrosine-type recombinase/integrase [Rhodovulum steppense]|uniref:Phage integrase family protein n=1 Tax=Rhodovulum steppense TaxID=540251 RepID=A0A4R1YC05_9RHOB|nr:tyrosine-type recombinase/integrase [Rhodovulum steppense]TCM73515.1 phage integrase family protein [Rhodovulum steppense]
MSYDPYRELESALPHTDTKEKGTVSRVLDWLPVSGLAESTQADYRRVILKLPKVLGKSLEDIALDWRSLADQLPKDDPKFFGCKTAAAAKAYRRKAIAAVKGASGEPDRKRERQSRQDGYSEFMAELKRVMECKSITRNEFHPKQVICLRSYFDLARQKGIEIRDLNDQSACSIYTAATRDQKRTVVNAITLLNRLRTVSWGNFERWLPSAPIEFKPPDRRRRHGRLPEHLDEELAVMVEIACKGTRDPSTGKTFGGTKPSPVRHAAYKVVHTALDAQGLDANSLVSVAGLFDRPALTDVIARWQWYEAQNDPRAIKGSTAIGYLARLTAFLEGNGYSSSHVSELLRDVEWLVTAQANSDGMTPAAKHLCKQLWRDRQLRLFFLSLHVPWRKEAMGLLRKTRSGKPHDGVRLVEQIRKYGVLAAFAALETDAAPLRVTNALEISYEVSDRLSKSDAWLLISREKGRDAALNVPAGTTKNGKPINAPIRARSQFRGLSTIRWYIENVRPLFPHHESSNYLFPAIGEPGRPLAYQTFLNWWNPAIRETPMGCMTPHNYRHGQATILINARPGDWAFAASRLGDEAKTVERRYGWIDHEHLMIEGHRILEESVFVA